MSAGIVAFAFGSPCGLPSNQRLAEIAATMAKLLQCPIYTQQDLGPIAGGIEVTLTAEDFPKRVPTLRIARGAVGWARERAIDELWLCAAGPHVPRVTRDLRFAIGEAGASIQLRTCAGIDEPPVGFWFSDQSTQLDTRFRSIWLLRDAVLMGMPVGLYALVAG
jgi:hypothetical protein